MFFRFFFLLCIILITMNVHYHSPLHGLAFCQRHIHCHGSCPKFITQIQHLVFPFPSFPLPFLAATYLPSSVYGPSVIQQEDIPGDLDSYSIFIMQIQHWWEAGQEGLGSFRHVRYGVRAHYPVVVLYCTIPFLVVCSLIQLSVFLLDIVPVTKLLYMIIIPAFDAFVHSFAWFSCSCFDIAPVFTEYVGVTFFRDVPKMSTW